MSVVTPGVIVVTPGVTVVTPGVTVVTVDWVVATAVPPVAVAVALPAPGATRLWLVPFVPVATPAPVVAVAEEGVPTLVAVDVAIPVLGAGVLVGDVVIAPFVFVTVPEPLLVAVTLPTPAEFVAVAVPAPVLRAVAEVPTGPVFVAVAVPVPVLVAVAVPPPVSVAVAVPGPLIVTVELVGADVVDVDGPVVEVGALVDVALDEESSADGAPVARNPCPGQER